MWCKKPKKFFRWGRLILRIEDIKDIIFVVGDGEKEEEAKPPFKLQINVRHGSNISMEFDTWQERQDIFEKLWELMKDL